MHPTLPPGLPRFFQDPNVGFPEKPVLANGLLIRDVPRGLGIDFRGGPRRFIVRGSQAERVYRFLREHLDGMSTLTDILDAIPAEVDPSAVLSTLKLLHENGVLADAARRDEPVAARGPRDDTSRQFWQRKLGLTRGASSSAEVAARIAAARVVVVTSGLLGELTVESLGRNGFAAIELAPLQDLPDDDLPVVTHPPYTDTSDGLTAFIDAVSPHLAGADLCIVALHGDTPALREAVNEAAIRQRTMLIYAADDGETCEIISVDPRRSACAHCREMRRELTSEFALEDHLFAREAEDRETWLPAPEPCGESVFAATLAAGHIAGEAVRRMSAIAPMQFVNATLQIDQLTGSTRLHPVLRVPRCPVCSSAPISAARKPDAVWSH